MCLVTVSVTGVIGVTWDWIRVCVACIGVGVVRSQFHRSYNLFNIILSCFGSIRIESKLIRCG